MNARRLAAWAVLPLTAIVAVSACGKSGHNSGAGANTISIGIGEPQHLLPTASSESEGAQVLAALYAPLVDYDENAKPVEVAAQSVTSPDSKTWTIKLKPGMKFHNGEPVTADSYIDSWNYGAYGPNAQDNGYFFTRIQGYDAMNPTDKNATPTAKTLTGLKKVDDNTIQVTLTAPFVDFKSMLGYTAFFPLPKAAFGADGKVKADFQNAPIGDGPFKMNGKWDHNQKISVTKYDDYTLPKPNVDGIDFKIYQSSDTQYQETLANNLDVDKTVSTANLANAPGDFGDRFQQSPSSSFQFLAFPTYNPLFAKPDVRKAISMAIDRDEQVKTIFAGSQTSARSFVSPVVPGFRDDSCGDACKFDPAKAKAMYTAAGGPSKIQITYNADGGHKEWVEATCNQLNQNLGVQCVAQPEPKFADLLTKVKAHDPSISLFRLGWVMDYPSMEDYLGPLYSTGAQVNGSNYYGYSNPAFDKLVAEGSASTDPNVAIQKYQAAEDILAKDMPVVPMRFGQNNFVHSTNVKDVKMDLFNRVDLIAIQRT